jgi:Kdo2-lipid IVA lauroyltransferase/acyltransferase
MVLAMLRFVLIFLCRGVGFLSFFIFKKRNKIAQQNVSLCFFGSTQIKNKQSKNFCKKVALKSFMNQGQTAADLLLLSVYTKKNIDKYVTIKNKHYFLEAQQKNKGVIFTTAHFGSWELGSHTFALNDIACCILYNPIKHNSKLETLIKKQRERSGHTLIPKERALLRIFKQLKGNKFVSFVTDQYCIPEEGMQVPLFGQRPWTHTGFIKLSLKTGAPIVPVFMFTKNFFKYEEEICKPLYPENFLHYKNPEYEMARAHNKALEKAIKKSPSQWMWQHRKFKNM